MLLSCLLQCVAVLDDTRHYTSYESSEVQLLENFEIQFMSFRCIATQGLQDTDDKDNRGPCTEAC